MRWFSFRWQRRLSLSCQWRFHHVDDWGCIPSPGFRMTFLLVNLFSVSRAAETVTSNSDELPRRPMASYSVFDVVVGSVGSVVFLILLTVLLLLGVKIGRRILNTSRRSRQSLQQWHPMSNPGLEDQLGLLRAKRNSYFGGKIVAYNPSYEFAGHSYTAGDLNVVSRNNVTLVKALGHGAFGEVYEGILLDTSKQPARCRVAIKTLPAMSTEQAQNDFIMEALIMSVFDHANIVRLIGVCFDRHPQFIVLELLEGGDLKTFLLRSRPKPNQPIELTTRDLLRLAMDVAQGCRYLEENHFVHRDIAARNCLLTTNSFGRVAKIGDFGMARDVYKSDYYKKEAGKELLPVRWMPPEALLHGVFTSKTDVWSFGVLLWEVFSLGYRPYPGLSNDDVIKLITSGGRLPPPEPCPRPIARIMSLCWTEALEVRPQFNIIIRDLQQCLQDHILHTMPVCA